MKQRNIFVGPFMLVVSISLVGLMQILSPIDLRGFGLQPRNIFGAIGVLTMPFLHGNLAHFLGNIGPLAVLALMVSASQRSRFYLITHCLILVSGLFTWLLGSSGIVIGASGLIFAYWGFLIAAALHRKDLKSIFFAAITILIYGSLVLSLTEIRQGVSYAAHFSGLVSGVWLAKYLAK